MNRNINRNWTVVLLSVIVLAIIIWWTLLRRPGQKERDLPNNEVAHSQADQVETTSNDRSPHVPDTLPEPPRFTTNPKSTRMEQFRSAIDAKNVLIEFWGKVVDQNDFPIEGASVTIGVRRWLASARMGWGTADDKYELVTDAEGIFHLQGARGDALGIDKILKKGYELSKKTRLGFSFGGPGALQTDPLHPIVLRMWKLGESQQLTQHRLSRVGIPCDGSPTQFDLLAGKRVIDGGHLIVRLKRDPLLLPPGKAHYDWFAEFEMPNGGLIASDDEFMYAAPLEGYRRLLEINMPMTATNWVSTFEKQFYVKLNGGSYFGRINLKLSTYYNPPPTGLTLDITLNLSGSRNLQP